MLEPRRPADVRRHTPAITTAGCGLTLVLLLLAGCAASSSLQKAGDKSGGADSAVPDKAMEEAGETNEKAAGVEGGGGASAEPEARAEVERLVTQIETAQSGAAAITDTAPETPRTCDEVCDLKRSICESSSKICSIAERVPGDGYIAERCNWSGGQCNDAEERCDQCSQ